MNDAEAVALLRAAGHSDEEITKLLAEKAPPKPREEKEVILDLLELHARLEQAEKDLDVNPAAVANALANIRLLRKGIDPAATRVVYTTLA